MPRTKTFNEEEVLVNAMNLFWKQGYAATSMQDLVDNLGINRASLYDTFLGKEALFYRAFEHYRKTNTALVEDFLNQHPNPKNGFSSLFEGAINEALNDPDRKGCFVVNTTAELIPGDEKMRKILEDNQNTFESIFYNYLKTARENGQLKGSKDLKALAALLFTIYNGLRVVAKIKTDRKSLEKSMKLGMSLLD